MIRIETIQSQKLANNPLGDSTKREFPVFIPDDHNEHPDHHYPVIYALAPFTGTGKSFLNYDFYQPNLPQRVERLIAAGKMPPVIVVMVDSMTALGGNQFVDSSAVGAWAKHITEELVPYVEEHFPVMKGREHRGVFGASSGGYGALMMGLEHSDTFTAIASHAGDCCFEYCYEPDFPAAFSALQRVGGLEQWFKTWRNYPTLPGWAFPLLSVIALSASYSPNASAPFGFDLPFDIVTGAKRHDVLKRWASRDPLNLVERHINDLMKLKLIYIDAGNQDEYNLQHGARMLSHTLTKNGIPHIYETFDGGHRGMSFRYDVSLPLIATAIM